MSGICGVLALVGRPPAPAEIDPIVASLERRGPDGSRSWREGPVALGHALLATTPEALAEVLPLTDAASGCTITADCRLDNREELITALGLEGAERVIGDGELILRAYLRWGEDCPAHLLGDFAFAIWDPRSQTLFCARDHMGMRQLLYHHRPGVRFIFATEADAVLAQPDVPRRINEARIADFLDDLEGIDLTSTFFEDVHRLPPAHSLAVRAGGIALRRYWQLQVPGQLRLDSDDAYAAAFLEVFTETVRCRLRSAGPVGAMVSGGLDSSSVAAVAGRIVGDQALRSFSAIGPDARDCSETMAIQAVLDAHAFVATTVSFADLADYRQDLARAVEEIADPFDAHMNLVRSIYLAGHRNGVKVMLDGVGGDLAMTSGNRIGQLARAFRFRQAAAEARQEARFWGVGQVPAALMLSGIWSAFAPRSLRRLKQGTQARWADRQAMKGRSTLTRPFAAKVQLARRRWRYRAHLHGLSPVGREYQLRSITHPHTVAARERYDRIAGLFAVEPRDPFLDIRLLSFCLSLPAEQLKSDGWTKVVLRRAMEGLLPPGVVWRRGKDHLGLRFTEALIAGNDRWVERWALDAVRLQDLTSRLPRKTRPLPAASTVDKKTFIELFSLSCWLSRYDVPNG